MFSAEHHVHQFLRSLVKFSKYKQINKTPIKPNINVMWLCVKHTRSHLSVTHASFLNVTPPIMQVNSLTPTKLTSLQPIMFLRIVITTVLMLGQRLYN